MTKTAARAASASGASQWRALPILLVGTFLIVLDFFAVNVALPAIQASLDTGSAVVEWVIAGYGASFAMFMITAGRVADQIGRRRVFALGLVLFGVASAACGLAPTAAVLIGARVIQGIGAALISPTVLALIGVLFPGAARARAISVYAVVMGLAASGGQLIGAALITADLAGLGWRAIFLINLPLIMLVLGLVGRLIPESCAERPRGLDLVGMTLLSLTLLVLVLPLISGRAAGWPSWAWACLGLAPLLGMAFVAQQHRRARADRDPLCDPVLVANRAFRVGLGVQLAYWCSQAPFYLVLSLYLQHGRGLSPLGAGAVFTIQALAYLVVSLRAPALAARHGRIVITLGALVLAVGFASLATVSALWGATEPVWVLCPPLVVIGAGIGLCITPLTMTVLTHADPQRSGLVSGALSTMQQAGNTLGVALTGIIFFTALPSGYGNAFTLALAELASLLVGVAALSRLLPTPRSSR
ncbi:MAG: MFS transporter [Mycobacterium sp.]|nr:MFS transporter [Mycobacterium sp.]